MAPLKQRTVVAGYRGIGLMSGTSADGIDVALVRMEENPFKLDLEAFDVFSYQTKLRERILSACSPDTPLLEVGELHVLLGEAFAKSALKLIQKRGLNLSDIDFIGSHGQTLFHRPPSAKTGTPFTLQIGDGSLIAERTGILTVSDFRPADMAEGGEGAPLIPYVDWKLFTDAKRNRLLLNLGGVANFTYLPGNGKLEEIAACDTGPANALSDSLVKIMTNGKKTYDPDGKMALEGRVNPSLLKALMSHPFIRQKAPKSADREIFGEKFAHSLIKKHRLSLNDFLATAAEFVAESAAVHLKRFPGDEVYLSGGGEKNQAIVRSLESVLRKPIYPLARLGIPGKAKEAAGFALLAYETLKGRPSNVPNVTGAKREAVLGKISPGRNKRWKLL